MRQTIPRRRSMRVQSRKRKEREEELEREKEVQQQNFQRKNKLIWDIQYQELILYSQIN